MRKVSRYWITAAVAFAIVWSLLAYAVHSHPAATANGQDAVCTVCADLDRDSAPPSLPQLLPPVAQITLPYRTDAVAVAGTVTLPAYLSRGPPNV